MRFDAGGATHRAMIGKRTSLWASSVSRQVRVTAEDRELLLIEWLEELVYLLDADQLPDRQLCCAPLRSSEGRTYLAAMAAAAG